MDYPKAVPRFSNSRRSRANAASRRSGVYKMSDPSLRLSHVSPAALKPVSEFEPHNPAGHKWQKDAFAYNRLIGEVGALHSLTAELVASSDLQVVEDTIDPSTGKVSTALSHNASAARVMRAFVGPVGGQKELKRRAALHYQICGESILVGTPLKDAVGTPYGIAWEFLSTQELKIERKKVKGETISIVTRTSGSEGDGPVTIDASTARWWRSDPEFSMHSDSPMRRVLPICRELLVLSEVVDAIAKSRLNAGILLVPDELSFGPDDESSEEGTENEDIDKFMHDLMQHLSAPVEDRTSGASLIPLLLKAPQEFIDKIKMLWLARDLEETYQALRHELLVRIAQGLDAPPEIITGKASLNHWSAFSVDSEFVDRHVAPLGEALCEFLTTAYLRRMLVRYEGFAPEEAARFRLLFDPRPIAQRNDEAESATSGWDRILLSDDAWARSNGFVDGDLATDEERKRRIIEKMILSAPGIYGLALLPILYPELGEAMKTAQQSDEQLRRDREARGPAVPELEDPSNGPRPVDVGGPENGVPDDGPPTERPSDLPPEQRSAVSDDSSTELSDRLVAAANEALSDVIASAASAVRDAAGVHPSIEAEFAGLTSDLSVLSAAHRSRFGAVSNVAHEVLSRSLDDVFSKVNDWLREWAIARGAQQHVATSVAEAAAKRFCKMIDGLVRSAAYDSAGTQRRTVEMQPSMAGEVISFVVAELDARR